MSWLLLVAAMAQEVEEVPCATTSWDAVHTIAGRLEGAYLQLRNDEFLAQANALDAAIRCMDEVVGPDEAAEVHAHRALAAFVAGELESSRRAWAAYRHLRPDATPDPGWMPRGHPMLELFDVPPPPSEPVVLQREPVGGWRVDGEATAAVPSDRAFLLQGIDAADMVLHTGHHDSVAEVPQVDFRALDPTLMARRRARAHGIGTSSAAALAVAAGITVGLAAKREATVKDPATPIGEVEPAAVAANTLSGVAVGLGTGALVVGVTTWTVRW